MKNWILLTGSITETYSKVVNVSLELAWWKLTEDLGDYSNPSMIRCSTGVIEESVPWWCTFTHHNTSHFHSTKSQLKTLCLCHCKLCSLRGKWSYFLLIERSKGICSWKLWLIDVSTSPGVILTGLFWCFFPPRFPRWRHLFRRAFGRMGSDRWCIIHGSRSKFKESNVIHVSADNGQLV